MKLPRPGVKYDQIEEQSFRRALELADTINRKKNANIEMGQDELIIIRSPNGTRFYLSVSNLGVLTATSM
jgi:hypothetical protein